MQTFSYLRLVVICPSPTLTQTLVQKSLVAIGFKIGCISQDDLGYITHVIPPKQIPITENAIEFNAIDIGTTVGIATTMNVYIFKSGLTSMLLQKTY
jgi:hypothetical protein